MLLLRKFSTVCAIAVYRNYQHLLKGKNFIVHSWNFYSAISKTKCSHYCFCRCTSSVHAGHLNRFSRPRHCIYYLNIISTSFQREFILKTPSHYTGTFQLHTQSETIGKTTLKNIFSDSNRRKVQEKLDKVKPVRTLEMLGGPVKKPARNAAVLVPLCMADGEPSILFTLRSASLRKHRGEVSFPGGNQDETDIDHTHTALRETFEEIGLNPKDFEIWGTLPPSPTRKDGGVVYPVIAHYTLDLDLNKLTLNADEVEEVFTCPIRDLCDQDKIGSTQFRTGLGYTLPVFLGGPHRIWGLSAIILHQTLTLIAPGLYTHKVRHVAS